jgi:Pyruvate/2-oxoacid:ferredoxin oxidoreductase delta subunit
MVIPYVNGTDLQPHLVVLLALDLSYIRQSCLVSFGCPMAAILGLQQRLFSKFRITTNGGQCISCGNCSTYCEMGIDVRSYAQKAKTSCLLAFGCGICAAVCPSWVLKLRMIHQQGHQFMRYY